MIRTQVYLTEDQYNKIKLVALQEKKAAAEVTRELINTGLEDKKQINMGEALMKIAELGKKLKIKGPKNLSTNIDKILYEEGW